MTAARCPVKTAGVALISRQHYDALRVIFDAFNLSELSNASATMPNAAPTIALGALNDEKAGLILGAKHRQIPSLTFFPTLSDTLCVKIVP